MKLIFSDRIGKTSPKSVLQIEGMNDSLRNSLWNFLLKIIFTDQILTHRKITVLICERFMKLPIDELPIRPSDHKTWFKKIFYRSEWYNVYNLIEFFSDHCYSMRNIPPDNFKRGINIILEEEMSGYRFISGSLAPISNIEELESIADSIELAKQSKLLGIGEHIETAIRLLSQKPNPDYRNSIKESISALESLVKQISGKETGGLEKALSTLDAKVQLHGAFKSGLIKLYGYTSDEDGIRHPILEEANVGFDEAKFMLITCSAIINFLISKASKCGLLK